MNKYRNYFITSGSGVDATEPLVAFDNALLNADIANYNLVKISSILPPNCKKADSVPLEFGSPILTAYGTYTSNKVGEVISSAVAIGIPANSTDNGVIMEISGIGTAESMEKRVRNMTERAMDNHNIKLAHIVSSSTDRKVLEEDGFVTVISAVCIF